MTQAQAYIKSLIGPWIGKCLLTEHFRHTFLKSPSKCYSYHNNYQHHIRYLKCPRFATSNASLKPVTPLVTHTHLQHRYRLLEITTGAISPSHFLFPFFLPFLSFFLPSLVLQRCKLSHWVQAEPATANAKYWPRIKVEPYAGREKMRKLAHSTVAKKFIRNQTEKDN